MKIVKKVLGNILILTYAIIAVTVTVLLLSYNKYGNTQIGGYTFVIVDNNDWAPEYKKGDLLLIENSNLKNINAGDKIFWYMTMSNQYRVQNSEVILVEKSDEDDNVRFVTEGNYAIDGIDVIGKSRRCESIS